MVHTSVTIVAACITSIFWAFVWLVAAQGGDLLMSSGMLAGLTAIVVAALAPPLYRSGRNKGAGAGRGHVILFMVIVFLPYILVSGLPFAQPYSGFPIDMLPFQVLSTIFGVLQFAFVLWIARLAVLYVISQQKAPVSPPPLPPEALNS